MARLATISYEHAPNPDHGQIESYRFTTGTGTSVLDTGTKTNTGPSRGSVKCTAVAGTDTAMVINDIASTLGRTYFYRGRFMVSTLPTNTTQILTATDGNDTFTTASVSVRLTSAGKLQLFNNTSGTQIGSNSGYTVAANTWFRLDMSANFNTGAVDTVEARVDGVVIATGTSLTVTDLSVDGFWTGIVTAPGNVMSIWLDDGAVNDDQGANENTYPGDNYVATLLPVSDVSRVGFTTGNGGTTSLFDALNNLTPTGVVATSGTATSQIKDSTNNTTDNAVFNIEAYSTVGMPLGSKIVCMHAVTYFGGSTTTAQTMGFKFTSNPSSTEDVPTGLGQAVGTWSTGWGLFYPGGGSTVLYNPTVTLTTQPTYTIRQATASTDTRSVAMLAYIVEVALPGSFTPIFSPTFRS